ncbi:hypothetical protein C1H46_000218 [Malus baccata]|uniref:UDP-glycosyltransferases domain-containing protein n=1 Tax=Malus baccata TaxID=106549 RepID=A0A540NTF5_MALBA|nr:hypothetical protein C1H46_000218 [Malus baccata]
MVSTSFKSNNDACMKWLDEQLKGSVAYMAFGSAAQLQAEQMEELEWGLRRSKSKFLWVVLAHEAVGCFVTHCGWNSTLEALSLGVPIVALPQWTDQSTNAKYIMDVWKIGMKAVADEKGVVRQEVVELCISEIIAGERGREIKKKALEWKELARKAVYEGGSSSKTVDEFIENVVQQKKIRVLGEI